MLIIIYSVRVRRVLDQRRGFNRGNSTVKLLFRGNRRTDARILRFENRRVTRSAIEPFEQVSPYTAISSSDLALCSSVYLITVFHVAEHPQLSVPSSSYFLRYFAQVSSPFCRLFLHFPSPLLTCVRTSALFTKCSSSEHYRASQQLRKENNRLFLLVLFSLLPLFFELLQRYFASPLRRLAVPSS